MNTAPEASAFTADMVGNRVRWTDPKYGAECEGVYMGRFDDEGEPYHYFCDGSIRGIRQQTFGHPVDRPNPCDLVVLEYGAMTADAVAERARSYDWTADV